MVPFKYSLSNYVTSKIFYLLLCIIILIADVRRIRREKNMDFAYLQARLRWRFER